MKKVLKRLTIFLLCFVILSGIVMTAFASDAWNPSMPLPARKLSSSELNAWINQYGNHGGISQLELEVFRLTNIERQKAGVHALTINLDLFRAARFKSQDLVDLNYWFTVDNPHYSPVYGGPTSLAQLFTKTSHGVGENLYNGPVTAEALVNGWMNSPGHKANILNSSYRSMGVGFVRPATGSAMSTQMFSSQTTSTTSPVYNGWHTWPNEGGNRYHFSNGTAQKGFQTIGSNKYYFNLTTGVMQTGWQTIDGERYYFHLTSGIMQTGWQTINSEQYYFHPTSGIRQTGWQTISGERYYFSPTSGIRQTGWQTISSERYYFNPTNGVMQTGWQTINSERYYFHPTSGIMQTGMQTIDGNRYYFGNPNSWARGVMQTGWQTIDNERYYFHPTSGVMQTGWLTVNNERFYLHLLDGVMQTGWQTIDGKQYYFAPSSIWGSGTWFNRGVMVTGSVWIDNVRYSFNENGVLIETPDEPPGGTEPPGGGTEPPGGGTEPPNPPPPTGNPITLTPANPSRIIDIGSGEDGRVPITVTAPSNGSVTVSSSNRGYWDDPTLYDANGWIIADDEAGNLNWSYTIPAGQTMTIYAGEYYDYSARYTVTAVFPSAPPPPDPKLINFVESLYQNIQGRASDEGGMEFWARGLQDGTHTGASTSGYFFFSPEYVGRGRTDVEFINDLYNTCMGRDADDGGMEYWLSQMAQGASRKLVLNSFLNGNEFRDRCAEFGVTPGRYEVYEYADMGLGITTFVFRCYEILLGREAERAGLNNWAWHIIANRMPPTNVARNFVFSDEFVNKGLSNEEFLDVLYRGIMGRAPDEGGYNHWMGILAANPGAAGRQLVFNGFAASKEWADIVATFGL